MRLILNESNREKERVREGETEREIEQQTGNRQRTIQNRVTCFYFV